MSAKRDIFYWAVLFGGQALGWFIVGLTVGYLVAP